VLGDVLPGGPGAPVEFEATVNGVDFRLLAEKITRDRRFAQARITVSGRGIAAALGDPLRAGGESQQWRRPHGAAAHGGGAHGEWRRHRLESRWQLTDWLVPGGAWSHSGSHIEACTRLAEAAGGYVQASRNSRTLAILPRYPAAPWTGPG
jgi:hypothetical protein